MHAFDIENKSYLKDVLLENLKLLGVRCRLPKKSKDYVKEIVYSENQIFQKPLHLLKKSVAWRLDGSSLKIPEFIAEACSVIEKDIRVEGIFRKAGSTCKQKERRLELNQGKKLNCEYHVLDACSLLKLFFRELPQPLIPYSFHDVFLKGLLLSTYEKEVDALMLACLLLPEDNLATLAFFMEFLLKVSWHSEKNKMNVKNLAIILTPTLMPLNKDMRTSNHIEMANHFKVIEMLIENAERIGKIPDQVIVSMLSISNKKSKKKRRSGSITRMFSGLKKIVGSRSSTASEWNDSIMSTPENLSSLGKRKNTDTTSTLSLSAKKKCLTETTNEISTPLRCRMNGYAPSLCLALSPALKRTCTNNLEDRNQQKPSTGKNSVERGRSKTRTPRLNLSPRSTAKRQKSEGKLESPSGEGNLLDFKMEKNWREEKFDLNNWERQNSLLSDFQMDGRELGYEGDPYENVVDLSDNELITVHKSEYEDIKNRVSALEEDIELLTSVHSVQYAYNKTLEESERLHEESSDHLAKRLSKELKIRPSSENKVMRSPSARKIGSVRRRSRELIQRNSEPKTNLKRGRPNTVQTGLPSPRLRAVSNENISNTPKVNPVARSLTFRSSRQQEDWKSAESFFANQHFLQKQSPIPQGRPSLAEIRCQNAGMVLEKAKLFNSMNKSNGTGNEFPTRRQSIRLENLKRLNEMDKNYSRKMLTRTRSLGSDNNKLKNSPLFITSEDGVQSKAGKEFKENREVFTPKGQRFHTPSQGSRRETPSLKKSLVTRSPRNFAKTPVSQMRTGSKQRATPMRVLPEGVETTPRVGLRRSPRFLARTTNPQSRWKE